MVGGILALKKSFTDGGSFYFILEGNFTSTGCSFRSIISFSVF